MKAEGREVTQTLKWTLWTAVTDVGGGGGDLYARAA